MSKTGYAYFLENALAHGWMIPQGAILLWSGSIASIPTGWVFCNGSNSTPDLRDKFVVGAKQDDGGVAKSNIEGSLAQAGGEDDHYHAFTTDGHVHHEGGTKMTDNTGAEEVWDGDIDSEISYDGGDTETEKHIPPYYALAYIMKT